MEPEAPIALDRAIFLSDAHLSQDDLHTRNFLSLAEEAAAEGIALFLLGDIFDLWFGSPGLTFKFQKPVIERLQELRRGGLRLYYVEGNRDFYLKKTHEGSTFHAVSEGEMRAAVGSRIVSLSHGDTVNRADLAYRFWKTLSKNPLAYGVLSVLPPSLVLPVADRLERKLKKTNPRFKESFPERESREFALRMFASGVDFVILGHFHTERILRFAQGEATKILVILPSWKEEWRYFTLTAEGEYGFRNFRPDAPLL
ncbi:MAG TPA: UDP-2,3-diacylglucosamine diphosphatase [Candidatus Deferrimicrobiaceae bacterium]|jgi:UDP-2,3-diacylglucosamine hydrolase|nr:UDP-2,3-diacylglucosamine diphosphatase [Candidatus Deferrimicrobiaceae bacterium]